MKECCKDSANLIVTETSGGSITKKCSICGKNHYEDNLEPGEFQLEGMPIGELLEGTPDDPRGWRVMYNPATGGTSLSKVTDRGELIARFESPLVIGRDNEPEVIKVIIQKLRTEGHDVYEIKKAQDHRGVDAILKIEDREYEVQITTIITDSSLWRTLNTQKFVSIEIDQSMCLDIIRTALEHKSLSAVGTILVLDATYMGAVVSEGIIEEYHQKYGNPCDEYKFHAVWIVGPNAKWTMRLG